MSMKYYQNALTAVVIFLENLDALLISFRIDDYNTNGYITIPAKDAKDYEVCVQRKKLWNTYAWFHFNKNDSVGTIAIMTDGVDETQQKLKMRDLYRSISEIDLHKLADAAFHFETIISAKSEALSALSTWFTSKGMATWFEENRFAEEDKSTEDRGERVMSVVSAHDAYVEEVKDRLLSLYKQLNGGCNNPQKLKDESERLENECKNQYVKLNEAYKGLQYGCTNEEKLSDAFKKVRECVEIFWRYNGGQNVPVWQQGWRKWEMSGDDALRVIGDQVRPKLQAAGNEDGGITNWYLRGLIATELAYIETGLRAYAGQATKQVMESGKKNMRMQNLLNMLKSVCT